MAVYKLDRKVSVFEWWGEASGATLSLQIAICSPSSTTRWWEAGSSLTGRWRSQPGNKQAVPPGRQTGTRVANQLAPPDVERRRHDLEVKARLARKRKGIRHVSAT
jgi:hypothetical protein